MFNCTKAHSLFAKTKAIKLFLIQMVEHGINPPRVRGVIPTRDHPVRNIGTHGIVRGLEESVHQMAYEYSIIITY